MMTFISWAVPIGMFSSIALLGFWIGRTYERNKKGAGGKS